MNGENISLHIDSAEKIVLLHPVFLKKDFLFMNVKLEPAEPVNDEEKYARGYEAGWRAAEAHKPLTENPYTPNTPESNGWLDGWHDAHG